MHDLSLMAASEWAQQHKGVYHDPVEFGAKVAQVYLACQATVHQAGDEKATAGSSFVVTPVEHRGQTLHPSAFEGSEMPGPDCPAGAEQTTVPSEQTLVSPVDPGCLQSDSASLRSWMQRVGRVLKVARK